MSHFKYSPVGHGYNAADYCLDCAPAVFGNGRQGIKPGACNCCECRLDRIAKRMRINRMNEMLFDSGDFPKAIPYHNDLHADCGDETSGDGLKHCYAHCDACGEIIDGPCPALEGDESQLPDTLRDLTEV